VLGAGKLIIVVPEAAHKVGERTPGETPEVSEVEAAIVVEVVVEIIPYPPQVCAELQVVFPLGDGKRVLVLERRIMKLRRSLRRRPQVKGSVDEHQRRGRSRGVVGIHVREPQSLGVWSCL